MTAALAVSGWTLVVAFIVLFFRWADDHDDDTPAADVAREEWDDAAHLAVWPSGDELIAADEPVDTWGPDRIAAEIAAMEREFTS